MSAKHPLETAFVDYGTALGKYENASSLAYNLGAEVFGRLVNAAINHLPIDAADLAAEAGMCRDAGKQAEQARIELKAAWARIGAELNKAKGRR